MIIRDFKWSEAFETWKNICCGHLLDELLRPLNVHKVLIQNSEVLKKQGIVIQGYDWIPSDKYERHVDKVLNDTTNWLFFEEKDNKGTITTAEFLVRASSNSEAIAAIWLHTCATELERYMPNEWRGDIYRLLESVNFAAEEYLCETDYQWHHAMRVLIPDVIFSHGFLSDFRPTSYRSIIELCAIISKSILLNYKIIFYDTVKGSQTDSVL